MLDVHPPQKKIHGLGDFFLHLLTITVGLFIALALEGCVERVHQHHLRDEADANLRQELRDNRKQLASSAAANTKEKANLISALNFLQARAASKPYDIASIELGYTLGSLSDASWKTASATGTLSFIDYARVKKYASAYQLQDQWTQLQAETLQDFLQLQSYVIYGFDPSKMTAEDARAGSLDLRRTLSHLVALDQIGKGLDKTYADALGGK